VFTKEEMWDNYTYFIKRVVPVAEEAGVRIGIHNPDPPQPVLAGVPQCTFGNFEGFKKSLEIANSPNVGMCLCVGSWLEGGPLMGKDPVETIKYFGGIKKLFKVHFRNVSAPLPHFTETLIDRLLRHEQGDAGDGGRQLRGHRDPRSYSGVGDHARCGTHPGGRWGRQRCSGTVPTEHRFGLSDRLHAIDAEGSSESQEQSVGIAGGNRGGPYW
jgi:hypothetical protein